MKSFQRSASVPARGPWAVAAVSAVLVAAVAVLPSLPRASALAGPALAIDATADRHAIPDQIYGMNGAFGGSPADVAFAKEVGMPLDRFGGNNITRYNWQFGFTNTANDFFFENVQGPNHTTFIQGDRLNGAQTLLTLPTIGFVAKPNSAAAHPFDCGFKISKYGAQQANDAQFDPDCGNGVQPGGDPRNGPFIVGNNPTDTSTVFTNAQMAAFDSQWVQDNVAKYGTATNGGVRNYELDNEPGLWNSTHRDVHPAELAYDELAAKDIGVAAAIKAADAGTLIFGPSDWGYPALFDKQSAMVASSADKTAHGDQDLAAFFLAQMRAQGGARLLDYFDEHYYPQGQGVALAPAGNAATQALRLRSTRSLWDPSYVDESFISQAYAGVGDKDRVRLIPRMRDYVSANYPGTKLAISEYNWGGLESMNGALAQADVLGIFARERMDAATLFSPPHSADPGAFAFRLFRNFDGAGGRFGDTYVRSTSADEGKLSIYGAQRGANGALTVAVVNKTGDDQTSPLSLANFNAGPNGKVFRYSGADLTRIVAQPDAAVANNALNLTFPANSMTMLVLPPANGGGGGGGQADLAISATAGQSSATINVTNNGPAATSQGTIIVTVTLPAGVTAAGGGNGFTCTTAGQQLRCTRTASLPAGASATVALTFGATAPGTYAITISVQDPNTADPAAANNTAVVTVTIGTDGGGGGGGGFLPFAGGTPIGGAFPFGSYPLLGGSSTPFWGMGYGPGSGNFSQQQQQQQSVTVSQPPVAHPAAPAAPAPAPQLAFTGRMLAAPAIVGSLALLLGAGLELLGRRRRSVVTARVADRP